MQHKRFAVTKEWKPLPKEEPLVLVPCGVAPWSLFPMATLVDAEPISPCRADSKAVIQNYYLTVTEIVLQWDGMKRQILSVADFFASVVSPTTYQTSWNNIFNFTDQPWTRTSEANRLMTTLMAFADNQSNTDMQPYRPENILTIDTAQLPQRQRHVEGHDNVAVGDTAARLHPEDTVDRANPIFETQVEQMCALMSGTNAQLDGKGPRPVWIGQLLERDEASCKGLIRWYKTKTNAAAWFGSAWVEDDGWKYGTAQGYNSAFKKTGEWINLGDIVYWGFDLNESASNKGKLRKHDIQVIMFEIERYFSSQSTS